MHISSDHIKEASVKAAIVLVGGMLVGVIAAMLYLETFTVLFEDVSASLEPLRFVADWELFGIILLNNGVKSYLAMALGIGFGVATFIFLAANGLILGSIMHVASAQEGLVVVLLSILPHGLFEIPAIILAAALGFILGAHAWRRVRKKTGEHIRDTWKHANKIFFVYVLPALVIASFVEVFVTPYIVQLVG